MLLTEKDYKIIPAKVYYLAMHVDPKFILPIKPDFSFVPLDKPVGIDTYRHYYKRVGFEWNWLDRLAMTNEELYAKFNADNVCIFLLRNNTNDAGYAEFAIEKDYVEIVYFGLFPEFVGRGLGKFFLQWVINKAWSFGPEWIQLNTCELDHPNALSIYQNEGFNIVRTALEQRKVLL